MTMIGDFGNANARVREQICKKCQRTQPIEQFAEFLQNGRVYRRNVCSSCQRQIWAAWNTRQRQAQYRERLTVLRSVVASMLEEGLTRQEIARFAGVSRWTVWRLLKDSNGRFHEPTEKKILALYGDVMEAA